MLGTLIIKLNACCQSNTLPNENSGNVEIDISVECKRRGEELSSQVFLSLCV